MSLAEHTIRSWAEHPVRGAPFVAKRERAPRPALYGATPDWLPDRVRDGLTGLGIERLYTHQVDGLNAVKAGRHVVVATPTASGKTMVYNLATLSALASDPGARALYLFPTKALAHDQVVALDALADQCGVDAAPHAFDGDTPADARRAIRAAARVVVSNPDMLHASIMPLHDRWHGFFAGLKYVVLDELHVYRGVFGSHVANVIRRLKRICRFHGAAPQFVMCSATIANAREHAENIVEAPVTAVTQNGAPSGRQSFYLYNPPLVDGSKGIRGSYVQAARRLGRALHKADVPTIVFANSRTNVERLTRHLQEDVAADGGDPIQVSGYRGGYLPTARRSIEKGLRQGVIRTVVSTSALELGVDIGQLEACVLAGYPGSIASTLQRAGRAGRRDEPAVVILVTRSEPEDQYLAGNPDFFFEQSPENARIAPDNLLVVADHIKCAAFELPFEVGESLGDFGAERTQQVLAWLASRQIVHAGARRWQWTGDPYPGQRVSLRQIAEGNFTVHDRAHDHAIVGEVDFHAAASTIYPQAIYIVSGKTYQVLSLDWVQRRAVVEPVDVDYYTNSHTHEGVRELSSFGRQVMANASLEHGEVHVFERVVGFKKIRFATGENVGYGDVALPENELHTTAFWVRPAASLLHATGLPRHRVIDALEGIASALQSVAAVHLMCDRRDLGTSLVGELDEVPPGVAVPADPVLTADERTPDDLPTVYLYERYPGGVGFHEHIFNHANALLGEVEALLGRCRCDDGCPACVGAPAPMAHEADRPRSRKVAKRVLDALRRPRLRLVEGVQSAP